MNKIKIYNIAAVACYISGFLISLVASGFTGMGFGTAPAALAATLVLWVAGLVLGFIRYNLTKAKPGAPLWIRISNYITADPSKWLLMGTLFGYLYWQGLEKSPFVANFKYYLMASLFFMGLNITLTDWKRVVKNPKIVLITFLTVWVVMPAASFAFGYVVFVPFLPAETSAALLVGLVLLGTTPTGTASNTLTFISNGDMPNSVTLTSVSTILTPLLQPMLIRLLIGDMVAMDTQSVMFDLLTTVVVPVVAGSVLGAALPKQIAVIKPVLAPFAILSLGCVMLSTMSRGTGALIAQLYILPFLFLALILLGLTGMTAGYFVTKKLFKFDEANARMACYEVGVQNSALTSGIALTHFSPLTALPAILYGKLQNLMAAMIFVKYFAKMDEKAEAAKLMNAGEAEPGQTEGRANEKR